MSMLVNTTAAYRLAVEQSTELIVFDRFVITSEFGYVPGEEVRGTVIHTGEPADPFVEDGNRVKYSVLLASSLGPMQIGTVGLYRGNTLMAVGVMEAELIKNPLNTETDKGGAMVIDFHLPMLTEAYAMWADVALANTLKLASANGPHLLPNARSTNPNIYTVNPRLEDERSFLAYCNRRGGPWEFDQYNLREVTPAVIASRTSVGVTRALAEKLGGYRTIAGSDFIVQIMDGKAFSACRFVKSIMQGPSQTMTLTFDNPLTEVPALPYRVAIYESNRSLFKELPYATTTEAGKVRFSDLVAVREVADPASAITPVALGWALNERFQPGLPQMSLAQSFTVPAVNSEAFAFYDDLDGSTASAVVVGATAYIIGVGYFTITARLAGAGPNVRLRLRNPGNGMNALPGTVAGAGTPFTLFDPGAPASPTPLQQAVFEGLVSAVDTDDANADRLAESIHPHIPDVFSN